MCELYLLLYGHQLQVKPIDNRHECLSMLHYMIDLYVAY